MDISKIKLNELSSVEKKKLLKEILYQRNVTKQKKYNLSYGQNGLWIFDKIIPNTPAYNIGFTVRICSKLKIYALEKSLQDIIDKHPVLKTYYIYENNEPYQIIDYNQKISFSIVDCKHNSLNEIREKVIEFYNKSFDLQNGPIFKVYLMKHADNDFILHVKVHHIACDLWSVLIILRELERYYSDYSTEIEVQKEKQDLVYFDFIKEERLKLNNEQGEQFFNFWENQLDGKLPYLELPTDNPENNQQFIKGKTFKFYLPNTLIEDCKLTASHLGVTLNMLFLATFATLLYRYTHQDDILIGVPTLGRNKQKFENAVGLFVNLVVLRLNLSNAPNFTLFVNQVRQVLTEALKNQDYPFSLLNEKLSKLNINKILRVQYTYQNLKQYGAFADLFGGEYQDQAIQWAGLKLKPFTIPTQEGQFDLDFELVEGTSIFFVLIKYNSWLFLESTIDRLSNHFKMLLKSIINNLAQPIDELSILTAYEKEKYFNMWFNKIDFPKEECIFQLIEKKAQDNPEKIALYYKNESETYHTLNNEANQIARHILKNSNSENEFISILLDRSPLMVKTILAVWKCGKAYIPIETKYPDNRIVQILEDSKVRTLVTKSEFVSDKLRESFYGKIIEIDKDLDDIKKEDRDNINLKIDTSKLAYIIYTSGSTGKPKGVMIEQVGMMNHIQSKVNELNVTEESIIAQNSSCCFDISIWQFFTALIQGGSTVICPDELLFEPKSFLEYISAFKVDILEVVPTFLSILLNILEKEKLYFRYLKYLLVTGETVKMNLVKKFFELFTNIKLVNAYGPTEASDDITHYFMTEVPQYNNVPIGKPIQNMNIYIVDKNMRLCPIGVKGEICVSGVGVGRGYLGDKEKTNKVFMTDPFKPDEKLRLYKTGDIGRWLPEGIIEFFGRIDYQVKIRGNRIELGEIESVLTQHEFIKEAIVIDINEENGLKNLCAYIIGKKDISDDDLRSYLSKRLPEYMIPVYFIYLEKFVTTNSGKIDRKALPLPEKNLHDEYVEPRDELEKIVADVWKDILGFEKVGITNSYFTLGGDSIKAIQISSKLRAFGYKVDIEKIFQNSTIKDLVPHISKVKEDIDQGMEYGEMELIPIQKSFFSEVISERSHWNQAIMVLNKTRFNKKVLEKVISKLVEHHDALRMVCKKNYEKLIYRKLDSFNIHIKSLDLTKENNYFEIIEEKVNLIHKSIDLFEGPLIKFLLFKTTECDYLLIVIHHLITDGISWRIILEDLLLGYNQLINNNKILFPEKTHSFKKWSDYLIEYSKSKKILEELEYWKELCKYGVYKQRFIKLKNTRKISLMINEKDSKLILEEINSAYNTDINDILLSILSLSLTEWKSVDKLLIDLEGHGREMIVDNININRTVGWFTSKYPYLLENQKGEDISVYIRKVKEGIRKIPNKGIGYGILRYLSDIDNDDKKALMVFPEVCFNYLGELSINIASKNLEISNSGAGKLFSDESETSYLIDINGLVKEKKLHFSFVYDIKTYNNDQINELIKIFESKLKNIISHCMQRDGKTHTPSDFNAKDLDFDELDEVFSSI